MSLASTIYSVLSGDAAVAALVAARIYPNRAPQTSTLPRLVYQVIGRNPNYAVDGASLLTDSRVQVTAQSRAYDQARALIAAVVAAIAAGGSSNGYDQVPIDTGRDLFDDPLELHCVAAEFSIWTKE